MNDFEIDLRSAGFVFCRKCCCADALGTSTAAQGSSAAKHWFCLPLAEVVHHEAKGSDVDLLAIREIQEASRLENSALQSQRITERHPQGLGRIQQVHTKPGAQKEERPLSPREPFRQVATASYGTEGGPGARSAPPRP